MVGNYGLIILRKQAVMKPGISEYLILFKMIKTIPNSIVFTGVDQDYKKKLNY